MPVLEFSHLVETFQREQRTGFASTLIPPSVFGAKEQVHVHIHFVAGLPQSCQAFGEHGRVYMHGQQAFTMVGRLGVLDWIISYTPQRPVTLPFQEVLPVVPIIPQQSSVVVSKDMLSWTRSQRQVFNLIDGRKRIENIAALLHLPYERVESVLHELEGYNVVSLQHERRRSAS